MPQGAPMGLCPACLLGLAESDETVREIPVSEDAGSEFDLGLGARASTAENGSAPKSDGRLFQGFELLGEIARGGMGVVYRARQVSLNREVALKMILGGRLASEADVSRFRAEAQAAAGLQHPNIVAIHEVGEHAGQHFFSMDYVPGSNLAVLARREPLLPERAAGYVRKIARAVHYAHSRGVIHRDLKPQNVLIDSEDEPRITDFGLAKQTGIQSELTVTGAVLGSPSYMAPEQAGGRLDDVGPRSDVYSMGAMLYELLTGHPPSAAGSIAATIMQILSDVPAPVQSRNLAVPDSVDSIVMKMLAKNPANRYQSAAELHTDLDKTLNATAQNRVHSRDADPRATGWGGALDGMF